MGFRVNLTDIEDRSFEAIPAGKYVVKITGWEQRETKDKPENKLPAGTPMVNWEFTILRHVDGDDKYKNRKVWTNTIIDPKTLFNLKNLLKACGWTAEQMDGDLDFDPDTIVGSEIILVVAVRQYNGDDTNDVKRFIALSDADREATASLLP